MGRLSDVTVLFADCRGFTALMQERGPEVVTPVMDEFFRRCSNIVVGLDGMVDHFMGDAVMSIFNAPIRHEDHTARAVEVAIRIQAEVPDINAGFGDEDLLKIGIGVSTGWAFCDTVGSTDCKDYTAMGNVVNIASRLQGQADPGEIMVDEEAYRRIKADYPAAQEHSLELKGIGNSVVAYSIASSNGDRATS